MDSVKRSCCRRFVALRVKMVSRVGPVVLSMCDLIHAIEANSTDDATSMLRVPLIVRFSATGTLRSSLPVGVDG